MFEGPPRKMTKPVTIVISMLIVASFLALHSLAGAEAKKPSYGETDRIYATLEPGQAIPALLKQRDLFAKLKIVLKPDGSAGSVTVEESSGDPKLDATAVARFKGWKFPRRGYDILFIPLTFTRKQLDANGELQTTPYMADAVYAPAPEFPGFARSQHLEGSGLFAMHVQADGTVGSVDVVKSTGHSILNEAAISTLQSWRFPRGKVKLVKTPVNFSANRSRR